MVGSAKDVLEEYKFKEVVRKRQIEFTNNHADGVSEGEDNREK